jgi:hypothetical protein
MKELKYHIVEVVREYRDANGRLLYTATAKVIPCGTTKDYYIPKKYTKRSLRNLRMPCEICDKNAHMTRHHLIPASIDDSSFAYRNVAFICKDCHIEIHRLFPNGVLAREYNSVERLKAAPEVRDYLKMRAKLVVTDEEAIAKSMGSNLQELREIKEVILAGR